MRPAWHVWGVLVLCIAVGLGGAAASAAESGDEMEDATQAPYADLFAAVWLTVAEQYAGTPEVAWDEVGEEYHEVISFAASESEAYEMASEMVALLGDPGTFIRTPAEVRALQERATDGEIIGVGMLLGSTPNAEVVVLSVLDGGPASQAGVRRGERIAAVDGASTADKSVNDVAGEIRGEQGSTVELTLMDPQGAERSVRIVRAPVQFTPEVSSRVLPGNIGYLSLTSFRPGLDAEFLNALRRLYRTRALLIDLRQGDGAVDPTVVLRIAGLFTEDPLAALVTRGGGFILQPIRQWEGGGDSETPSLLGPTDLDFHTKPVAVLADDAVASSVFTLGLVAGLQESGRATIIGRPSTEELRAGKGYSVFELPGGGFLNVATSLLLSLEDREFITSFTPDVVVPMDVNLLKSWYDGNDLDIEAGRQAVLRSLQ